METSQLLHPTREEIVTMKEGTRKLVVVVECDLSDGTLFFVVVCVVCGCFMNGLQLLCDDLRTEYYVFSIRSPVINIIKTKSIRGV